MPTNVPAQMVHAGLAPAARGPLLRSIVIALTAFLTLVDLFATQAILPSLASHYGVSPAQMSVAVNATTAGMALASLLAAVLGARVERRDGILASLALLTLPTAALAIAPNLAVFTALRVCQGLCMASAFTLTLALLGERCTSSDSGSAFAAYIAGNVASNLFGRLLSAAIADHAGIAANFIVFAGLNLAGAALVYGTVTRMPPAPAMVPMQAPWRQFRRMLGNHALPPAFGIGFCILFAFIGTYSFVNFVLVGPPIGLTRMQLGLIYLVFLPSLATTLGAGAVAARLGTRVSLCGGLALAAASLPLLLLPQLGAVVTGLALFAIGTFFAQAVATGYVARHAEGAGALASGTYLAAYFAGGLCGTAALGTVFDRHGWAACVAGIFAALGIAAVLASRLDAESRQA